MDKNIDNVIKSLKEDVNTLKDNLPDVPAASEEPKVIDASKVFKPEDTSKEVPKRPEFQKINNNYINSVATHASSEVNTLEQMARKDPNVAAALAYDARTLIMQMLAMGSIRVRGENTDVGILQDVVERYYAMIGAFLQGQNIAPITGDESEWVDVEVDENAEKVLKVRFRDKNYEIKYDTVQANTRCPGMFRFNGDNRFAHVTNFYKFHDIKHPENVYSTAMSRRFITFPYFGESYDADVELAENGEVARYIGLSNYSLTSKILYPRGDGCFIASPIPVYMLSEVGVNIDEEMEKFDPNQK